MSPTQKDKKVKDLSSEFMEEMAENAGSQLATWLEEKLEQGLHPATLIGFLEIEKAVLTFSMIDWEEEEGRW